MEDADRVLNQQYKHCVNLISRTMICFFNVACYWPTVPVPESSKTLCLIASEVQMKGVRAGCVKIKVYFGVFTCNVEFDIALSISLSGTCNMI